MDKCEMGGSDVWIGITDVKGGPNGMGWGMMNYRVVRVCSSRLLLIVCQYSLFVRIVTPIKEEHMVSILEQDVLLESIVM
jgi:hypothetical protein